jgi:hypothetical protein
VFSDDEDSDEEDYNATQQAHKERGHTSDERSVYGQLERESFFLEKTRQRKHQGGQVGR